MQLGVRPKCAANKKKIFIVNVCATDKKAIPCTSPEVCHFVNATGKSQVAQIIY